MSTYLVECLPTSSFSCRVYKTVRNLITTTAWFVRLWESSFSQIHVPSLFGKLPTKCSRCKSHPWLPRFPKTEIIRSVEPERMSFWRPQWRSTTRQWRMNISSNVNWLRMLTFGAPFLVIWGALTDARLPAGGKNISLSIRRSFSQYLLFMNNYFSGLIYRAMGKKLQNMPHADGSFVNLVY